MSDGTSGFCSKREGGKLGAGEGIKPGLKSGIDMLDQPTAVKSSRALKTPSHLSAETCPFVTHSLELLCHVASNNPPSLLHTRYTLSRQATAIQVFGEPMLTQKHIHIPIHANERKKTYIHLYKYYKYMELMCPLQLLKLSRRTTNSH